MNNRIIRKLHRILAPILFLPFLLTAITGIIYRISETFFAMPEQVAETLLAIHQGAFLGEKIVPIYVFLNGLGMIGMLVTGIVMSGVFRNRQNPNLSQQ